MTSDEAKVRAFIQNLLDSDKLLNWFIFSVRQNNCIVSDELEAQLREIAAKNGYSDEKTDKLVMAARAYATQCRLDDDIPIVDDEAISDVTKRSLSSEQINFLKECDDELRNFLMGNSTSFVYKSVAIGTASRLLSATLVNASKLPISLAYLISWIGTSPATAKILQLATGKGGITIKGLVSLGKYLATGKVVAGFTWSALYLWQAIRLAIIMYFLFTPLVSILKPKYGMIVIAMEGTIDAIIDSGLRDSELDSGRTREDLAIELKRRARMMLAAQYESLY